MLYKESFSLITSEIYYSIKFKEQKKTNYDNYFIGKADKMKISPFKDFIIYIMILQKVSLLNYLVPIYTIHICSRCII